jgi:hypothetical protein
MSLHTARAFISLLALALVACSPSVEPLPGASPPGAAASAPELFPFADPPPQFDMSKVPKLPPGGATFVTIDVDRIAAVAPKGIALLRIAAEPPVPVGIEPAANGIEVRLTKPELSDAYQSFTYQGSRAGDPERIISFVRIFDDQGRLAACGFYVVRTTPQRPGKDIGNHFHDLRSYLAIGNLARLPVNFLGDRSAAPARPDGKFSATCVDSNIRWQTAYAAAPLSVHLEANPFVYKWTLDKAMPLGPGH